MWFCPEPAGKSGRWGLRFGVALRVPAGLIFNEQDLSENDPLAGTAMPPRATLESRFRLLAGFLPTHGAAARAGTLRD